MQFLSSSRTEFGDTEMSCHLQSQRLLAGMADLLHSVTTDRCRAVMWRLSPEMRRIMIDLISGKPKECQCSGCCIERVLGVPSEPTSCTESSLLCEEDGGYRIVYCLLDMPPIH